MVVVFPIRLVSFLGPSHISFAFLLWSWSLNEKNHCFYQYPEGVACFSQALSVSSLMSKFLVHSELIFCFYIYKTIYFLNFFLFRAFHTLRFLSASRSMISESWVLARNWLSFRLSQTAPLNSHLCLWIRLFLSCAFLVLSCFCPESSTLTRQGVTSFSGTGLLCSHISGRSAAFACPFPTVCFETASQGLGESYSPQHALSVGLSGAWWWYGRPAIYCTWAHSASAGSDRRLGRIVFHDWLQLLS